MHLDLGVFGTSCSCPFVLIDGRIPRLGNGPCRALALALALDIIAPTVSIERCHLEKSNILTMGGFAQVKQDSRRPLFFAWLALPSRALTHPPHVDCDVGRRSVTALRVLIELVGCGHRCISCGDMRTEWIAFHIPMAENQDSFLYVTRAMRCGAVRCGAVRGIVPDRRILDAGDSGFVRP